MLFGHACGLRSRSELAVNDYSVRLLDCREDYIIESAHEAIHVNIIGLCRSNGFHRVCPGSIIVSREYVYADRSGSKPTHTRKFKTYAFFGRNLAPVDFLWTRIGPEDSKRTGEEFKAAREALGELCRSEEDMMSYICFPDQAEKFFKDRKAKEENVATYTITEA